MTDRTEDDTPGDPPRAEDGLDDAASGGAAVPPAADAPEGEAEVPPEDASEEPGEPGERPRRERVEDRTPPPPERLEGAVEAMLLASGDVLTAERLRDLLGLPSAVHVREAIELVRRRWSDAGLAVEVQDVAGGLRVVTRPEYAEYVRRLVRRPATDRLGASLLETLSIVAYKQPVARVEIERIRGVQAGEALRGLLDRHLVKVVGRSDQPGRPLLYGTTRRFLEVFGLRDLKDLPVGGDLQKM